MNRNGQHNEPESVEEVIGELDELASHGEEVCIGDVLDDFGGRSFGPFILIFALLEITPIGAIPGAPTVLASIIALVAIQLFIGREHIWMPQFIQNRSVGSRKLHKAVRKLRGIAHWLDEHSRDRLDFLTQGRWLKLAAAAILLLCVTVPPLEVLPFASSGPMLAIAAIALALIVRDGLVMLAGLVLAAAALGLGTYYYYTSADDSGEDATALVAPFAPDRRLT